MENKTNPNDPAYPLITGGGTIYDGLTKREEFAKAAMQGIMANSKLRTNVKPSEIAEMAVKDADALIEALNKPVTP